MDAKQGLDRLDEIALAEYAMGFEKAIDVPEEKLKVRRAARLAGIELKHPFAQPLPTNGPSETGAFLVPKVLRHSLTKYGGSCWINRIEKAGPQKGRDGKILVRKTRLPLYVEWQFASK
jgi:hypothetical protein